MLITSKTTAKRQQFANDLTNPQLIAVTDNVNQAKGDKSPDLWKPPLGNLPHALSLAMYQS